MLVKFKSAHIKEPICVDSSRIYAVGNTLFPYDILQNDVCWEVDDATLAYLENAWLHEGMRRVSVIIPNDESSCIKEEYGWLSEMSENIFLDNGTKIKNIDVDSYSLIPYELEEQK